MSIWIKASSSPNRKLASDFASSVLPTPDGPAKMNEPEGRLGSFRPATRTTDRLRDGLDRLFLADDPLVQFLFHCGADEWSPPR